MLTQVSPQSVCPLDCAMHPSKYCTHRTNHWPQNKFITSTYIPDLADCNRTAASLDPYKKTIDIFTATPLNVLYSPIIKYYTSSVGVSACTVYTVSSLSFISHAATTVGVVARVVDAGDVTDRSVLRIVCAIGHEQVHYIRRRGAETFIDFVFFWTLEVTDSHSRDDGEGEDDTQ